MSPPQRAWNSLVNRQNMNRNTGFPANIFPGNWNPDFANRLGVGPGSHLAFQSTGNQIPNNNNTSGGDANGGSTSQHCQAAPPLPPRPEQQQAMNNPAMNRYGGLGNGLGYSGFNSYSPYSYSSPMYGSGYSPYSMYGNRLGYGAGGVSDYYGSGAVGGGDNFFRMAEESSRQAFQSIESIVQAFGSVSMMLESTYHAVYSSFRAVIGVADHFSRLKNHLAQILSTLALVRTLHWLFRKALYLLGLSRVNPASEGAWSAAAKAATENLDELDLKRSRSSWPIMMFFGVVLGAPWLIWKLLSAVDPVKASDKWKTGEDNHYEAVAKYDFQGETPKELSFRSGQKVVLAPKALQPKIRGWLLASVDGAQTGLVPANYLKILGARNGNKIVEMPTTSGETVSSANHHLSPPHSSNIAQPSTSNEMELP